MDLVAHKVHEKGIHMDLTAKIVSEKGIRMDLVVEVGWKFSKKDSKIAFRYRPRGPYGYLLSHDDRGCQYDFFSKNGVNGV